MNKHVSLALNLSDGFLNRPVKSFMGMRFFLNGLEVKPILKTDGWCIFINLPQKTHELRIESRAFAPYVLQFTIENPAEDSLEVYHTLAPTEKYLFGRRVVTATLRVAYQKAPLVGETVYIAGAAEKPLKLAQDKAAAGDRQYNLFSEKPVQLLNLPGQYLVEDGAKTEVLSLVQKEEDGSFLAAEPLQFEHSRGAAFVPVQAYLAGENGQFFFASKDGGKADLFWQSPAGYLKHALDMEKPVKLIDFAAGGKKHGVSDGTR